MNLTNRVLSEDRYERTHPGDLMSWLSRAGETDNSVRLGKQGRESYCEVCVRSDSVLSVSTEAWAVF